MIPLAAFWFVEGSLEDGETGHVHEVGTVHGAPDPAVAAVDIRVTDDPSRAAEWAAALREGRWPK